MATLGASLLLRSLFTQGSWNERSLIGAGVAWALLPVTSRKTEGTGRPSSQADFDEPFNSHPYLTPLALGALARCVGDGVPREQVRRFREALCSPLGSLGDRLIWGAWRPLCLVAGALVVALGAHPTLAVVGTLAVYNFLHIALRAWGVGVGLRLGLNVGQALRRARLAERSERLEAVGVLVLGVLLGLLLGRGIALGSGGLLWVASGGVLFAAGTLLGGALRRWTPVLGLLLVLMGLFVLPTLLGFAGGT